MYTTMYKVNLYVYHQVQNEQVRIQPGIL